MISKICLAMGFCLLLAFSAVAGQQEEIGKAMKLYGEEASRLMNDSQDALGKGIPEVEDYFNNPGEIKKPQESFFGFGEKRPLPEPAANSAASCQSCQTQSIESLRHSCPEKKKTSSSKVSALQPSSSVETIVFVSLGMPEQALRQLAIEAEKTKARLVIRGLLDNSFKATMARLQELKIPVEIDPALFELFEVERVPAFIRCTMTAEGAIREGHDRLAGNIFIRDALEKFEKFGDLT